MSIREKIVSILQSRVDVYSPAEDVAPHVTNAPQIADLISAEIPEEQNKMKSIGSFCPPGTQIKSPGGLSLDVSTICAVESYGGHDGYIIVHMPNSTVKITFYENVQGGAPEVYAVAAALQGKSWP
jgi:hypothetical protein